tara:strand:- start:6064 stop:6966 length:903 start_codon:yes stop_codon:yes gene_type:complete
MAGPSVLEISGLTKAYGSNRGINDVSLTVGKGEIFGFLGPNGAGKSTTIRILLDLIRPTSGSARLLGMDVQKESASVRHQIGYLPGEVSLYEWMKGHQLLSLLEKVSGRKAILRDELVDRLRLDSSRKISRFSSGMKQKLAIVAALQHDPPVLVLDEPTGSLDPLIQQEVYQILREFQSRGRTIFFSSHVLSEVEQLCDRVAIIREGAIVAIESVFDLRSKLARPLTIEFDGPIPVEELKAIGVSKLIVTGNQASMVVPGNIGPLIKTLAKYDVVDLDYGKPTLEKLFLGFYRDDEDDSG